MGVAARERRGELGPSGEELARGRMGFEPVYLYLGLGQVYNGL